MANRTGLSLMLVIIRWLYRLFIKRKGYIYLIENRANHKLKIGYSVHPYKRLKALQTGSSERLDIAAIIRGTFRDEAALHRKFRYLHYSAEWFYDNGTIRNYFQPHKSWSSKLITIIVIGALISMLL